MPLIGQFPSRTQFNQFHFFHSWSLRLFSDCYLIFSFARRMLCRSDFNSIEIVGCRQHIDSHRVNVVLESRAEREREIKIYLQIMQMWCPIKAKWILYFFFECMNGTTATPHVNIDAKTRREGEKQKRKIANCRCRRPKNEEKSKIGKRWTCQWEYPPSTIHVHIVQS